MTKNRRKSVDNIIDDDVADDDFCTNILIFFVPKSSILTI